MGERRACGFTVHDQAQQELRENERSRQYSKNSQWDDSKMFYRKTQTLNRISAVKFKTLYDLYNIPLNAINTCFYDRTAKQRKA